MFFSISLLFAACTVLPQVPAPTAEEDSLFLLFEQFQWKPDVEEKHELNACILDYMSSILANPESFEYRFDSLRKRSGILKSDDNRIRIFTWNIPLNAFEHEYHGIIQVYDKRRDTCLVHILTNRFGDIPDLLHAETGKDNWTGALYYDIIRTRNGRDILYTLCGFNFYQRYSDMKIIEVLHFDEEMNPHFGKPVFNTASGMQHRVVFEYSGDVAMNLRFNPDLNMIVYDHLAPIEPELQGHARFYAPDFSYDGYKFRKGIWEYQEDLDVRNR